MPLKKIISLLLFPIGLLSLQGTAVAQACNCVLPGPNLITNGDFETDWTSDVPGMILAHTGACSSVWGSYGIGNNAKLCYAGWNASDHTFQDTLTLKSGGNPAGHFLIIDPDGTPGNIYNRSVSVCPNTNYRFTFWAKNLLPLGDARPSPIVNLQFNGVDFFAKDITIDATTNAGNLDGVGVWQEVSGCWFSGSDTSVIFSIAVKNVNGSGNDLGIDDISFTRCNTVITVTPSANSGKVCPGSCTNLTVSVSPGGGVYTYKWSPGGQTTTTINVCPAATTTYTVTVSGIENCVPFSKTADAVVTVNPPILINIAGFPPKCFNGTDGQAVAIPSGGNGTYTYQWSPVAGTGASINGPAGTYSVTVTDLLGCTAVTSTVIANPTPITGTTSSITAYCNKSNGSATVATVSGGTPGYTYSWNTSPVQNTQTASNISSGNYIVTITDANGCTASLTAFVPNVSGITASIPTSVNVSCYGGNDGSATASGDGGTQPYTYLWSNTQNTNAATNLTAGTYSVTVTDANGCSANTTVIITQPTQVIVSSTSANICPSSSATISATGSGGTGAISFTWDPGALTGNSISVSPASTTVYTLTGTDANGCTATTTATVTINSVPVVSVPNASICYGTTASLTATGATTYTWTGAGLIASNGNPVTVKPLVTTTYTVIGTDVNGCTGATTVVVTVNPPPIIIVPPASICPGYTATLTASGALTYTWSPAGGLSSVTGTSVTAKPNATTTYVVTGTNSFGCTAATTTTVTINPKPVALINASPNPATTLDPTVYFTDGSIDAVSWNWSLGDVNNSSSNNKNPSFTYPNITGSYQVYLIVTNQFGCIDTTEITVHIKGEFTFYIPNTFTPNGDGTNDGFMAKGVGIDETDYDLWIFDRWGNMIWHTSIWGEAWDGNANNGSDIAQIDTYVWKVHVREKENKAKHNYIGHVNIVR